MNLRLELSEQAEEDLFETWSWIAADSVIAANKWLFKTYKTCGLLCKFPGMGKHLPEYGQRVQGFIKDEYYIFYEVHEKMVLILHVVRGDRNLEKLFQA